MRVQISSDLNGSPIFANTKQTTSGTNNSNVASLNRLADYFDQSWHLLQKNSPKGFGKFFGDDKKQPPKSESDDKKPPPEKPKPSRSAQDDKKPSIKIPQTNFSGFFSDFVSGQDKGSAYTAAMIATAVLIAMYSYYNNKYQEIGWKDFAK